MANALAISSAVGVENGVDLTLMMTVVYYGTDVPGTRDTGNIWVVLDPADQPAAIRSKISAAIAASAVDRGFTVAGAAMTIPTFQKGI